jgi:hypothetical protein
MRKLTFITTLAVLLLAGCAHPDHGRMPPPPYGSCPCPNPANPQVTVDGGTIKLDQEILVFAPGVRGSVTWCWTQTRKRSSTAGPRPMACSSVASTTTPSLAFTSTRSGSGAAMQSFSATLPR